MADRAHILVLNQISANGLSAIAIRPRDETARSGLTRAASWSLP